jgi:hypothetical protein
MLATARRKALSARAKINFVHADMRSFEIDRRFSLIVLSCNSLAHLITHEDLLSCLRLIREHLRSNGVFAFDILNPRVSHLAEAAQRKVLDLPGNSSEEMTVEETISYDPVRQVRTSHWQIREHPGTIYRLAPLELRLLFPQELIILLQAVGLNLVARYGDFSRGPFEASSRHQICLADYG